jgi:ubiquinone/menaquinone biosynthesis C-methylase UbiE
MTSKYDKIGFNYNLTRTGDNYLISQFEILLGFQEGGTYLDIGCGTGNYTIGLNRNNIRMIGVDPSIEMLKIAQKRDQRIKWILGSAENLSIEDESIDGVFGCMTLHHWSSLEEGFIEINRVLKDKGVIILFTSSAEQMKNYWLNHYFPQMMRDSITQMPTTLKIESSLIEAGFTIIKKTIYNVDNDLKDKFLYSGKNDPKIYLNESVRKGISSFASLAYKSEVKSGLLQLESDIKSQEIVKIIDSYKNDFGDYFFIKAGKYQAS